MNRPQYNFSLINRLPPYVLGVVNELKHQARARGEDIIDLGMGNPDQATPDYIVEKLREAVREPRNHRYSTSAGLPKLRLAITDWYKRKYDVDLDPDSEAVVTIGSKEGISHLMLSILSPGDMAIVPDPYLSHTQLLRNNSERRHSQLSYGEKRRPDTLDRKSNKGSVAET